MQPLRSVVAIGAGFFTTMVLSLGGDFALRQMSPGDFGPDGGIVNPRAFTWALAYSAGFGILGGYVAGRIGQERPVWHATVAGLVVLAFTAFGASLTWGTVPAWYHTATIALALPMALLGGKISEMRSGPS